MVVLSLLRFFSSRLSLRPAQTVMGLRIVAKSLWLSTPTDASYGRARFAGPGRDRTVNSPNH